MPSLLLPWSKRKSLQKVSYDDTCYDILWERLCRSMRKFAVWTWSSFVLCDSRLRAIFTINMEQKKKLGKDFAEVCRSMTIFTITIEQKLGEGMSHADICDNIIWERLCKGMQKYAWLFLIRLTARSITMIYEVGNWSMEKYAILLQIRLTAGGINMICTSR